MGTKFESGCDTLRTAGENIKNGIESTSSQLLDYIRTFKHDLAALTTVEIDACLEVCLKNIRMRVLIAKVVLEAKALCHDQLKKLNAHTEFVKQMKERLKMLTDDERASLKLKAKNPLVEAKKLLGFSDFQSTINSIE